MMRSRLFRPYVSSGQLRTYGRMGRQGGKFTGGLPQSIKIALRRTVFDGDVAVRDVAKIVEALTEVIPYRRVIDKCQSAGSLRPLAARAPRAAK